MIETPAFTLAPDSGFGTSAIYGVAYGDGLWVAVGVAGKISISTDRQTWTPINSGTTSSLFAVSFGSGRWVAAGSAGTMITSTDGTTWVPVTSPFGTSVIRGLTCADGLWVAVGGNGKTATSSNGASGWTLSATAPTTFGETTFIYNVRKHAVKFVAVASGNKIGTSTNGSSWTLVTSPLQTGAMNLCVAAGNGLWAVANSQGEISYSTNATAWTAAASPFGVASINGMDYYGDAAGDLFVAAGQYGRIGISRDSIQWALINDPFSGDAANCVAASPDGLWVIGGAKGKIAFSVVDLFTVTGTITDGQGQPAARTVRLYRRSDGALLAEVLSDAETGEYSFTLNASAEVQRIVVADDIAEGALFNDIIDRVLPG